MKPVPPRFRPLLTAVLLAVLLSSCRHDEPDPMFISTSDLCLQVDGRIIHRYVPETWQIGFSRDKVQFRVHSDNMSDYYILTCTEMPEKEGQKVSGQLKWSTASGVISRPKLDLKVEKTDPSTGQVWLWDYKKKIGISVMPIR